MTETSQDTGSLTIAATMMVRNEEENLARCLNSIKDIVDEIVIVDTGSEDKTVEIAESFGARVYHHPWEDNFSLHRNQSMKYAESDWVFVIDADEEVTLGNGITKETLKRFIKEIPIPRDTASVAFKVMDMQGGRCVMEFNSTRIFKKGMVHYEGIVHNAPQIHNRNGAAFCDLLRISHFGYDLTPEKKQKKFERTSGLIFKKLEAEPENWLMYFYLAQVFCEHHDPKKGCEYGEIYIKHKEELRPSKNFNPSIYFTLVINNMKIGNTLRAKELIFEGFEEIPEDLDLAMAMCEWGVQNKALDMLVMGGKQYTDVFNNWQKDPALYGNRFVFSNNIHCLAQVLYYMSCSMVVEGSKYLDILVNQVFPKLPKELQEKSLSNVKATLLASTTNIGKKLKKSIKPLAMVGGQ